MRSICTHLIIIFLLLALSVPVRGDDSERPPLTSEDLLALKAIGSAEISPDGARVAFVVLENDFEADQDMSQLWVAATAGGEPMQLTHGEKPVGEFEWSPDGQWLAFIREKKLSLIRVSGGEAKNLQMDVDGIANLRFSPDGGALNFIAGEGNKELVEAREKRYGDYTVFREDGGYRHIWRAALTNDMALDGDAKQLTQGREYSVVEFALSPNGEQIAFATWSSPHMADLLNGQIYLIPSVEDEVVLLDESPGVKRNLVWHPQSKRFAYTNAPSFPGYSNIVIRRVNRKKAKTWEMTSYNPGLVRFGDEGLLFGAGEGTTMGLYLMNPADGTIDRLQDDSTITRAHTLSNDGLTRAHIASAQGKLDELVVVKAMASLQLTAFSDQLAAFELPSKELITWTSFDGLEIEAVLTRPAGFKPGNRYPLFVRTHGGPTGTDRPWLAYAPRMMYLPEMLASEGDGALVLQTNYRGSANYGEAFQMSNLRNLGIGPARDIIAGVEMLIEQGLVDSERVGCLGWSQGGHISAMLATYSDICTAAIMGAGISDWRTYYYNTDITQFTTEYFDATPLADDDIYAKTSPVSYIDRAKTPVLIQHGEKDTRVPIANGYQLRQLLLDKGVESRMIVYSGMGHGPAKPRMRRAINDHALAWFRQYLFDQPAPDYVHPVAVEEEEQ